MKVSIVILVVFSAAFGAELSLDINRESRVWTGGDIASRSADNNGESRAWTGWDVASRGLGDAIGPIESRAWTGWDIASRGLGDAIQSRAWTGWDVASRGLIGDAIRKGKALGTEVTSEMKTELRATLAKLVQSANQTFTYLCQKSESGNYTCSVCMNLAKANLCSNLIIDTANISATVNIKLNNYTLISKSIGVKNPPPICVPLPHVPFCTFCMKAYNIDFSMSQTENFQGCLEAELSVGVFVWSESVDIPLICMQHDNQGFHFNRTLSESKVSKRTGLLKKFF